MKDKDFKKLLDKLQVDLKRNLKESLQINYDAFNDNISEFYDGVLASIDDDVDMSFDNIGNDDN